MVETAALPKWLWIPRLIAAVIIGQTLYFKFTGAELPVQIFETLGAEPEGRIGTAVLELIAVILLIIRPGLGGALAAALMVGAIGAHLGPLGIEVDGDSTLFIMALVALLSSCLVAWVDRRTVPLLCKV